MGLMPTQPISAWTDCDSSFQTDSFLALETFTALQIPGFISSRFLFLGYLKEKVFSIRKETIAELQASIHDEIAAIPLDMLAHVIDIFLSRLHSCEVNEGGHLLDVIFKKW